MFAGVTIRASLTMCSQVATVLRVPAVGDVKTTPQ
jgi:hypothetical protein